ncbi:hypothetical protein BCR44DRAFT_1106474 [Catenaria anguillulae PL171]|uniref:K Homology domain-containing protein n=1 Tax=Catenaria anguillulae PL171 TaxID=765915 RepID=A0A1Y2HME4_9FUNG|nr:hypothetical protein BCR44DRAFT_1106474 [Catenaria anguillulae PL171]
MSSAALRTLAAVSRSRGLWPPWPSRTAAISSPFHAPLPPWPSSHTHPSSGQLRSFSSSIHLHAGKSASDSPTKPRNRLAFADIDANEQPMDHAEVLDPLRPPQGKHLSKSEYQQLLKRINVIMTKADLVMYLKRHASDTHSNLSAYLPMGTYLSPKTALTKPKLVRALVHGVWGVPELNASFSTPASSSSSPSSPTSASADGESDDPVMARVQVIPDHVSGTLEIPCTPRDLFFVHGHGDTVRSLMLQGGVVIHLDTKEHKIVVKGTGAGIKKTVGQIRSLLVRSLAFLHEYPWQRHTLTLLSE